MSVCCKAFHVSVIVSSSEACFIRVIPSNQGSGTDSTHVSVVKGDNARSGATSKVRGGALMMSMVSRPAVLTAPVIGAVTGFMSRVLTVTSEAVNMRGEGALSLAKQNPWRRPWVLHSSMLQAVLSFALCWVVVRRSLCCEDAQDDTAWWTPGSGVH